MSLNLTTFMPAGGTGSRLHPHTSELPKPLLLMGSPEERLIDHPLGMCVDVSDNVFVSTDYLAEQVEEYLRGRPGVQTFRDTGTVGSGGSMIQHYDDFSELEPDADLLVVPSDHVYDGTINMAEFLAKHRESGANVTLMTVAHKPYGEYVEVNDGVATQIQSQPSPHNVSTTGTYMFKNSYLVRLLSYMKRSHQQSFNIYKDIVCPAVGTMMVATFFIGDGPSRWEDAGTPGRYLQSNMRISGGANVISKEATVENGARLSRCVVLGNAVIKADAEYRDAIISADSEGKLKVTCLNGTF